MKGRFSKTHINRRYFLPYEAPQKVLIPPMIEKLQQNDLLLICVNKQKRYDDIIDIRNLILQRRRHKTKSDNNKGFELNKNLNQIITVEN